MRICYSRKFAMSVFLNIGVLLYKINEVIMDLAPKKPL